MKGNTFRETRTLFAERQGDRCIIFKDQGSTDPTWGVLKSERNSEAVSLQNRGCCFLILYVLSISEGSVFPDYCHVLLYFNVNIFKDSRFNITASIAHLVERPLSEREVVGSNPAAAPYQRCKKWY